MKAAVLHTLGQSPRYEDFADPRWKNRLIAEPRDLEMLMGFAKYKYKNDEKAIELLAELSKICDDATIAQVLNRLGYRTGADNAWIAGRVQTLRSYHRIAAFDPAVDGTAFLTMERAAAELSVSAMTIRRLITAGVLTARQPMPYAPWIITREALGADRVQRAIAALKRGRPLPQTAPVGQLTLANSTT